MKIMSDLMHNLIIGVLMFLLVGASVWAGVHLTLLVIYNMARKNPDKFIELIRAANEDDEIEPIVDDILNAKDAEPTKTIRMDISAVNDILIAHDATTGEFLAQGKTTSELIVSALTRYPGKEFTVAVNTDTQVSA
jgi:hypothetical protein